jgi:hypothetical protein
MSLRYTFRLKPERDSDLIAWLNSLGEGERSCFIRQALRKALGQKEEMCFRHGESKDLNITNIDSKLDQLTNVF